MSDSIRSTTISETTIDMTRFEELSEGDTAGLQELIQLYLTKTNEQIVELEKGIATGATSEVARVAHSMVGANAMVGMDRLVPLLRTLESSAEAKDMKQIQKSFHEIQTQYQVIRISLQKHIDGLP